jgi:peptidoglycan biosynthesis protein MviN/MurJ (putative lipid II flippase)
MRIGAACVAVNLALNLLFILLLPSEWKHAGLALGTVGAALIQLTALAVRAHRLFVPFAIRPVAGALVRHGLLCIPLALTSLGVHHLLSAHVQFLSLPMAIVSGAAVYFALAILLRYPEVRELRHH